MKILIFTAFIASAIVDALVAEGKNDLALKMTGHDNYMLVARCLSTGP